MTYSESDRPPGTAAGVTGRLLVPSLVESQSLTRCDHWQPQARSFSERD